MTPEFRVWNGQGFDYCTLRARKGFSPQENGIWYDLIQTYPEGVVFGTLVIKGEEEIEQYTGLKDINGNKIFEGDILKMHSHIILYGSDLNKWVDDYSPITWDKSMGAFTYQGELLAYQLDAGTQQDGIYHDALELVGNIHENPELLEVDSK